METLKDCMSGKTFLAQNSLSEFVLNNVDVVFPTGLSQAQKNPSSSLRAENLIYDLSQWTTQQNVNGSSNCSSIPVYDGLPIVLQKNLILTESLSSQPVTNLKYPIESIPVVDPLTGIAADTTLVGNSHGKSDNSEHLAVSMDLSILPSTASGSLSKRSPGRALRTNPVGIALIKRFEGLRLQAYQSVPGGPWEIGYGHTGPEVKPGLVITPAQAERFLRQDLRKFESVVRRLVKIRLNSNQFSALVSFTYNVGAGNFEDSTLLRLLNRKNYRGAANQFPRWKYANDGEVVLPGLVSRRKEERAFFLKPV